MISKIWYNSKLFLGMLSALSFLSSSLLAMEKEDDARSSQTTLRAETQQSELDPFSKSRKTSANPAFFRGTYRDDRGNLKQFFFLPSTHAYPYEELPESLKKEINDCHSAGFELDLDHNELSSLFSKTQAELTNIGILRAQGDEWWERLKPRYQQELENAIVKGQNLPYALKEFSLSAVFFVYNAIKSSEFQDKLSVEKGIDNFIYRTFKKNHKPVFGLETLLDRFKIYKKLNEKPIGLADLKKSITNTFTQLKTKNLLSGIEKPKDLFDKFLIDNYNTNKKMLETSIEMDRKFFEIGALLKTTDDYTAHRNKLWVPTILTQLKTQSEGHITLFVFGANHPITYDRNNVNQGMIKLCIDAGCSFEKKFEEKWYPVNEFGEYSFTNVTLNFNERI